MRPGSVARLATLALLWGSSFLWIKLALRGLAPVQVALVRLVFGSLVLLTLIWLRGRVRAIPRDVGIWRHLAVAAIFGNVIPFLLFAAGETRVDSAVAGVLNATTPLWTFVFALVAGDRNPSTSRIVGLAVGFAGTALIFSPWDSGSQVASLGGLACLAAAVSYGITYVYLDRMLARNGVPPLVLSGCQLTIAAGYLLLATPLVGRQPVDLRLDAALAVAVLGVFGTGIAYVLNYRMIAEDGATVASTVTYLLPVVAISLGVVFLDEELTLNVAVGVAVVLAGVALARRRTAAPVH